MKYFFFADDQYLDDFSGQIVEISAHFADICIQALNTRQEIIGLVKDNMSQKVNIIYVTNIYFIWNISITIKYCFIYSRIRT